jgi:fructokinase
MITSDLPAYRLGIDLGGTKIAGIVLDRDGQAVAEQRCPTPRNDYAGSLRAIADMVGALEARVPSGQPGPRPSVGIGMPGSISPRIGKVQNANSTWINGRPFQQDLEAALGRPVRLANDANCFALSEAEDGAGRGVATVFGVILGTGCGGGIVVDGRVITGRHAMGGEWGHTPLPWARPDEAPGPQCWCGRHGCLETWLSGPGLAADHRRSSGQTMAGEAIAAAAAAGDPAARASLERHTERLARGLAMVANLIDPDVFVLGGGLSKLAHLYAEVPGRMQAFMFTDAPAPVVRPPVWGDASGVRGAARLWP